MQFNRETFTDYGGRRRGFTAAAQSVFTSAHSADVALIRKESGILLDPLTAHVTGEHGVVNLVFKKHDF